MDWLGTAFAALIAAVAVGAMLQLVWGYLDIPSLTDVPPVPDDEAPPVSVIVAARDEERHIEAAVTSLLALRYPDYELVVVDDRSTDRTAEVLAALAAKHERLQVVRIEELPAGWLGKNHALHVGASRARGELLLFTDADVILAPDTLARAVRLQRLEQADHVTVAPRLIVPTWPLALVVNYFMMWFLLWLRPWKSRDSRSRRFIGIGAFNLVRAAPYRSLGGHERIALRPDDDIMLGKLLKSAGLRQLLADGSDSIHVEWYRSLGEMARGLRKNAFAGLNYSVGLAAFGLLATLALAVWPFLAVWLSDGTTQALYATAAIAQMLGYSGAAFTKRSRPWLALLYPVAALLFEWIVAAAVLRTLRHRGIEWRGTFYSLDELRTNRI